MIPPRSGPLQPGERVHLLSRKQRRYGLTLQPGAVFRFSGETLAHDALLGRPEGITVETSRGTRFTVLRPTLAEYILRMPRGAQVIYPKDIGLILMWADIYPGARVLEAGLGSGALTLALLRTVGPNGRVISYEIRPDFLERGRDNVERYLGPCPNHEIRLKDVYQGIDELELDRMVLDLPEPWQVVPHAEKALRAGGVLLALLPTVPQVQQMVAALQASARFDLIETFEALLRTWNVEGRSVRPDHRMVAHSAFLTVARKLEPGPTAPA